MSDSLRIALPGYDADTDTDLDHFALHSDEDNVLIKECDRGSVTVPAGGTATIPHNLGYIPLFQVYVNIPALSADAWALVGIGSILSMLFFASTDTTELFIANNDAVDHTFKYFVFYDDVSGGGSPTITESSQVLKIARAGVDALTSKNPNDYIFHSDLNTFKIVYQGKQVVTFTPTEDYFFAHHSPLAETTCMLVFVQFPDGKVTPVAWYGSLGNSCGSYNSLLGLDGHAFDGLYFDDTNIYCHNAGVVTPYDVTFVWYIFEASL